MVENTNRGVTTDFDGNFSISASTGEILVISYVGYTSQRIPLGANANLSIQMPLLMAPQLYLNQRLGGINDIRNTDVKKPPSGGFFV